MSAVRAEIPRALPRPTVAFPRRWTINVASAMRHWTSILLLGGLVVACDSGSGGASGETGIDFGPGLSEIGSKLPKAELYLAIVKPNAGVSFDYEGWTIRTRQGDVLAGIVSEAGGRTLPLWRGGGGMRRGIESNARAPHSISPPSPS